MLFRSVRESNVSQQLSFLQQQLQRKQFVAVGEAGLDKLAKAPMELQLAVFKEQVKLSEKLGLPLIIHCVKAMEELLGVKKESRPQQPWIWHGFRGKPEQAVQLLKKGFYLSFGEYYPDETMQIVPDERLFLETDDSLLDIEDILCQAARIAIQSLIFLFFILLFYFNSYITKADSVAILLCSAHSAESDRSTSNA